MKLNITPVTPESKHKIIRLLKKLPLFAGLYDDEFAHLCDLCSGHMIEVGDYLFKEGEHCRSMYVLLSGVVELLTQSRGLIYEVKPGEFFGEIGLITQSLRSASARAKEKAAVLEISLEDFSLMLGQYPRINAIMMRHIAENLANHIVRMNNIPIPDCIPAHTERGPVAENYQLDN